MRTASVSELKARLSRYLREARDGGEIQILRRGVPIARIVPPEPNRDADRQRLIASGTIRPGTGNSRAALKRPPIKLPTSIVAAILEEREGRI